eukprot:gene2930-3370_t
MSNIERGSNLLWVHLAFTFIVTGVTCFFAFYDYKDYSNRRVIFKQQNRLMNYTVFVKNIPANIFTKEQFLAYMESYFPGQVRDVSLVHQSRIIYTLIAKRESSVKAYEKVMEKSIRKSKKFYKKDGALGLFGKKHDALEFHQRKIDDFDKSIEMHRNRAEQASVKYGSGFVIFNQRQSAKILDQIIMDKRYPFEMVRYSAPDPHDVYWPNTSIGIKSFWTRTFFVCIFVFALVFFWSIPVTFLSGFSNLGTLAKISAFSWLVDVINKSSILSGFLQGFLPNLVLIIFMALLIPIITWTSRLQGHWAHSNIDESVFRKYFFFQVFNVFLVTAIAGSIFQSLEAIVDHPASIITLLANALPGQAFQMMNIIMIAAIGSFLKILRIIPLLVKIIKLRWFAKTPREIEGVRKSGSFSYAVSYAMNLLYLQICLAYSTMTPFLLIFGSIYFGASYLVCKYNIIWVNVPEYQAGGRLYPSAFRRTIAGLVIFQLLMIGVFNIYKFFLGTLVVIPLLLTLLFACWCETLFHEKSKYGIMDVNSNHEEVPINISEEYHDGSVPMLEYNETMYMPPYYSPLMAVNIPSNADGPVKLTDARLIMMFQGGQENSSFLRQE